MRNEEQAIALGAKVCTVRRHRPFLLDDPSVMWLVLSGSAEVRSCLTEDGFPVGPRRFLCRVGVGDALFAMVDSPPAKTGSPGCGTGFLAGRPDRLESLSHRRLMVLAALDLTLLAIPLGRMAEVCLAAGVSASAGAEGWVNRLSSFTAESASAQALGAPPPADLIHEAGAVTLDVGQIVRSERGVVAWVRVDEGTVCLMGKTELHVGPQPVYLPLGPDLWLKASGPVKLTVARSADLEGVDALCRGITLLHSLLLAHLERLDFMEQQTEMARLKQRDAVQQRRAEAALDAMASVLNPRKVIQPKETPVLGAVALVGDALGIDILPPPKSEDPTRVKNPLDAIARASRVRHRRVLLRGAWWKRDCGPLLGYLQDGHLPVALLRAKRAGYDIVDPETGSRVRVNNRTAPLLAPEAAMIYRRLPDGVTHPLQLVGFLFRGKLVDMTFIVGLATMATLLGMLTPLATAMVMDTAIPGAEVLLLVHLGLALIAAAFGALLLELAQGFVNIRMGISSDATATSALWDRLLNLRASFFKRFSAGDLLSRVAAVSEVNQQLNGATVQSLLAALMSLLNLGLLALFSVRLAVIAVALASAVAVVTIAGGYFMRKHIRVLLELRGAFFGLVVQMVNAVGKIRVAGAQRRAFTTWVNGYTEQLSLIQRAQRIEDYVFLFNQAVPTVAAVLLFWMGVELLMDGGGTRGMPTMSIGMFLAFNTAMGTFLYGATALSTTAIDVLETLTTGRRIQVILEAEQEVDESKADPGRLAGSVSLSHIDFRYTPGGRKILDDLSFHADPGEFVAIVGPSGSGKSTIFKLLLGFETPESGTVCYDGRDLLGIDALAVRRQLGVVLQSGRITAGSILENVSAAAQITLDEAWEAAEDAGFADDIRAMPMGFHTIVSEGGTNFSGGQRQRLLIARALVTRPKILLLDEATSALDNRTQRIVSESLGRRKVTRLVVAHRLSTIRRSDRIYVLDGGKVIETGSYDELAGRGGLFASLMARQSA